MVGLLRKHPAVLRAGKTIQMSDLEADPLVMFQHQHYMPCFLAAGFVLPTLLPHLVWGESLYTAFFMAVVRCAVTTGTRDGKTPRHHTDLQKVANSANAICGSFEQSYDS